MQLKMHENSLFAILLRKAWWISASAAAAIFGLLRFFLPWEFALFAAAPFIAISAWVAWQRLRAPSASRIAKTIERLRTQSWDDFSRAIEEAYRREGYNVSRLADARADFELIQGPYSTLVSCKRWKAMRTGIEPLRELQAAREAREAHYCVYVATGEITGQARTFAAEKKINLVQGGELTTLLRRKARQSEREVN
jgi:restriction system protein